jgi:NADPH:quinone reductase-like Zn-dependent oxidoreductase
MLTIVSIASAIMALENTKLLVQGQGSPLEVTTTAKPTSIESNEVMIRLKAIAINPADCKMIDQGHRVISWPLVPGLDGAGVVEAVGDDVKNFALGDEVLAMFTAGDSGGAFQNFAVVQETMVAKKPTTWSFEDAATLGYVVFSFLLCYPFLFSLFMLLVYKLWISKAKLLYCV